MPCVCKRKTSRGLAPLHVLERAAKEVREGKKSIQTEARDEKIKNEHVPVKGYDRVAEAHKVLSDDMESELAKHIKNLSDQFHVHSSLKCRELAYELAHRNNNHVPDNCINTMGPRSRHTAQEGDAFCHLEMNVLWCEKCKSIPEQQQRTL
uniref:Uncharacterized protein n=1 Tax=Hucho hucho TaxID=62062 RepID=A0A4W5K580_9TELE